MQMLLSPTLSRHSMNLFSLRKIDEYECVHFFCFVVVVVVIVAGMQ